MSIYGSRLCLASLSEDILLCIYVYLEPPDILRIGKTCERLHRVSSLRVVWIHAAASHVISKGFPFPNVDLDDLATPDLIARTKHGHSLANRWIEGISSPQRVINIPGTSGTSVSDVRFVPGHNGMLVTISKSIWSALTIWDIRKGTDSQKLCEWSPRGAIFTGFALNSDPQSEATIAVSFQLNERHSVVLLALSRFQDSQFSLKQIFSVGTTMKPATLEGHSLALADDMAQTAIWNWKRKTYALLEHVLDGSAVIQTNKCMQVLFAHQSILVVRARCIHLFPSPIFPSNDLDLGIDSSPPSYAPIAQHSFGWVDDECVTACPFLKASQSHSSAFLSLSILVRGETDDPWAPDVHNLELYTLDMNPSFDMRNLSGRHTGNYSTTESTNSPYIFPPRLTHTITCLRGSLRCKQVLLGRFGTAVWVQPRNRHIGGLLADFPTPLLPSSSSSNQTVITAVFPGSLNPVHEETTFATRIPDRETDLSVIGKKIFENDADSSWTSFDYDEVGGRVALGSSFGKVTILQL